MFVRANGNYTESCFVKLYLAFLDYIRLVRYVPKILVFPTLSVMEISLKLFISSQHVKVCSVCSGWGSELAMKMKSTWEWNFLVLFFILDGQKWLQLQRNIFGDIFLYLEEQSARAFIKIVRCTFVMLKLAFLYKPCGFMTEVSSPYNLLYSVKFVVTSRLINDDDDLIKTSSLQVCNHVTWPNLTKPSKKANVQGLK